MQVAPKDGTLSSEATRPEGEDDAAPPKDDFDRDLVRWTRGLFLWTRVMAVFTGALVLTAALQFWVMQGQLGEMKTAREGGDKSTADQLAVMRDQAAAMQSQSTQMQAAVAQTERAIAATNRLAAEAAKSAIETKRIADAAGQANQATKQGIVGIQRAFLVVKGVSTDPVNINDFGEVESFSSVNTVAWENIGNTATKDLRLRVTCTVREDATVGFPRLNRADLQSDITGYGASPLEKSTFGPKERKTAGICRDFVMDKRKKRPFTYIYEFVFGSARYKDMIDPASIHLTKFCYLIFRPLPGILGQKQLPEPMITLCDFGNCIDDECTKQDRDEADYEIGAESPPITATVQTKKKPR